MVNRIGIDTGGTFTDFVSLGGGAGRVHKVPSTPQDPLQAIVGGLGEVRPEGLAGVEVVHGTTVGTNAFLTRQGAKVVLLTTQGFEDVLFIGPGTAPPGADSGGEGTSGAGWPHYYPPDS
jgi:N-methylhydantoinase A/oxoprolinase/acetone carboxylase beta subunit